MVVAIGALVGAGAPAVVVAIGADLAVVAVVTVAVGKSGAMMTMVMSLRQMPGAAVLLAGTSEVGPPRRIGGHCEMEWFLH